MYVVINLIKRKPLSKLTMKIRICYHTSIGLKNDALMLKEALSLNNKDVILLEYNEQSLYARNIIDDSDQQLFDLQFFMEHIHHKYYKQSNINVYVPNIEFMNTFDVQFVNTMTYIWAKTNTAYRILKTKFPKKEIILTEWTSIDRFLPIVKTYQSFLHIRGCSRFKNTEIVLAAWIRHPEWPPITIIQHNSNMNGNIDIPLDSISLKPNITLIQRNVSEEELNKLMNTHNIHICPSTQEGFGHYINEARSCRAVVCTTHGYPMLELVSQHECLIATKHASKQAFGISYQITIEDFEQCIFRILKLQEINECSSIGTQTRHAYLEQKIRFHKHVHEFIKEKM